MKKIHYILALGVAVVNLTVMCKKPYNPIVADINTNILVVEGVIKNGSDSTIIKLSRTVNLNNFITANPVVGATVTIEDDQNGIIPLAAIARGQYGIPALNLDNSRKYRLRIKTPDGQVYLSDAEAVKNAPPIDSIGFTTSDKGVAIYANAHDATNNTRYYRWEFDETWRFHTKYDSRYVTDGTKIVDRLASIYYCFTNASSSTIVLGSTTKLSQDVMYQAPITIIAPESEKIGVRYSMLLKQYALTQQAYEFWSNIKRNTENLGSIFDAQPSAATGNIHCLTNPDQPVIGYISVGAVQTKRVFIDKSQLPAWETKYPYNCTLDSLYYIHPVTLARQVDIYLVPAKSDEIPVMKMIIGTSDLGYLGSSRLCTDCTIRGKLAAPPFWK